MNAHTKRILKKILAPFCRIGLKNKEFSIISNNCWGGFYYDMFNLPYLSPTIGLFIPPSDYIKLLENLKYYLNYPILRQIKPKEANCYPILMRKKERNYISNIDNLIIGKLDDIEIVFLHYSNFNDAKEKWFRRAKRVDYNRLIIKFNDQNECSETDVKNFFKLNYSNKIFFTSNPKYRKLKNVVFEGKYTKKYGFIFDDMHVLKFSFKKFINNIKF